MLSSTGGSSAEGFSAGAGLSVVFPGEEAPPELLPEVLAELLVLVSPVVPELLPPEPLPPPELLPVYPSARTV